MHLHAPGRCILMYVLYGYYVDITEQGMLHWAKHALTGTCADGQVFPARCICMSKAHVYLTWWQESAHVQRRLHPDSSVTSAIVIKHHTKNNTMNTCRSNTTEHILIAWFNNTSKQSVLVTRGRKHCGRGCAQEEHRGSDGLCEQLPNHQHRNLKAFEEHMQTHVSLLFRYRVTFIQILWVRG